MTSFLPSLSVSLHTSLSSYQRPVEGHKALSSAYIGMAPKDSVFKWLGHRELLALLRGVALFRVGVALLKEVCYCVVGFEVSCALAMSGMTHSLLLPALGSKCRPLSSFSSTIPAWPAICCVSHHDHNGLNLWNCKPASIKYFLLEKLSWHLFIALKP